MFSGKFCSFVFLYMDKFHKRLVCFLKWAAKGLQNLGDDYD